MNKQEERLDFLTLRKRGWTVTDAAKAVDRSVSHISRVLSGEHIASKETMKKLLALPERKRQSYRRRPHQVAQTA